MEDKNNIFDFWILQEVFNSLPEIELHDEQGNLCDYKKLYFLFERENKSGISRSPSEAIKKVNFRLEKKGAFPLIRCFAGVIKPKDFLEIIATLLECKNKDLELNKTFAPVYMLSFFCNPEGTHIYSSLLLKKDNIVVKPIIIPPLWFYLANLVKEKSLPVYKDIFELIDNARTRFIDKFTEGKELTIKRWILDTSFLMHYANLQYNPLLRLQNEFNGIELHFSQEVQKELEGLKHHKRNEIVNRAKKAIQILEEFRESYPDLVIYHELNKDIKIVEELIKKNTELSTTDAHAIAIAKSLQDKKEKVLLLATDINIISVARDNKILSGNRPPPAKFSIKRNITSKVSFKLAYEILLWFFEITELDQLTKKNREFKGKVEFLVCDAVKLNKNYLTQYLEQIHLPSFFIDEIQWARDIYNSSNCPITLKKYIIGNHKTLFLEDEIIKEILDPKNIPLARWPVSKNIHPFFSQYLAVSASVNKFLLNEELDIISVNGPPGSGKTTLLKEYVANTVEKMADFITKTVDKHKSESNILKIKDSSEDEEENNVGHVYTGLEKLCDLAIIVASANNNAVENVTKELPLVEKNKILYEQSYIPIKETLAKTELDTILWATSGKLSGICLYSTLDKNKKNIDINVDKIPIEFQSTFTISAVLGKKSNTKNFLTALNKYFSKLYYINSEKRFSPFKKLRKAIDDYKIQKKRVETIITKLIKLFEIHKNKEEEKIIANLKQQQSEYTNLNNKINSLEEEKKVISKKIRDIINEKTRLEKEIEINLTKERHLKMKYEEKKKKIKNSILILLNKCISKKIGAELINELQNIEEKREKIKQENNNIRSNLSILDSNKEAHYEILKKNEKQIENLKLMREKIKNIIIHFQEKQKKLKEEVSDILRELGCPTKDILFPDLMLKKPDCLHNNLRQRLKPYGFEYLKQEQEKLFLASLRVLMWTASTCKREISHNLDILKKSLIEQDVKLSVPTVRAIWGSFFLLFPVVSSTFHSLSLLFKSFSEIGSLGTLVIDEAGQGTSYMALGGLIRCKRAIIVGDPLQLEPVVTIPEELMSILCDSCDIKKKDFFYISGLGKASNVGKFYLDSSIQLLADRASIYKGIIPLDKENPQAILQVGIPLRVHFRCDYSILSVSNDIAYGGTVIHYKKNPPHGKIIWFSVDEHQWITGRKNVCKNEVEYSINLLEQLKKEMKEINPEDIFIISPFKDVAKELRNHYKTKELLQSVDHQIGTVHTFQGKEAPIVIFVLGGQTNGARNWAAIKPNLLNVAITRAKKEFRIVGDYKKWSNLSYFEKLAEKAEVITS